MIDIEALLVAWLEETIEDVTASTKTPADLDDHLPWVMVRRIGGPYDGYRIDRPTVDFTVYDTDEDGASALARQIQVLLHTDLRGRRYLGAVIGRITTNVAPHWTPYDNPNLCRYEASNALVVHPA